MRGVHRVSAMRETEMEGEPKVIKNKSVNWKVLAGGKAELSVTKRSVGLTLVSFTLNKIDWRLNRSACRQLVMEYLALVSNIHFAIWPCAVRVSSPKYGWNQQPGSVPDDGLWRAATKT